MDFMPEFGPSINTSRLVLPVAAALQAALASSRFADLHWTWVRTTRAQTQTTSSTRYELSNTEPVGSDPDMGAVPCRFSEADHV